ncbi:ABC transporter permease [Streptomyces sp. NPDC002917]|uniref:ABC transporter permease n=1 Tax=unclassified Streptomyces TaxID=2593676 RepID=UPI002E823481|nr:ABC transporter permease [Streptomyces sp. NBC_00562]WTC80599.1 ABC transporter permease [Streptomyces sp. NBC_01653]WTD90269.1 ABC transporter permease [Streptomyces sp. NBC_01637]WUC21270.1 ABC transporter permease [Streptomyces sp. NBC_00562]
MTAELAVRGGSSGQLAGTKPLFRLALRRDRIMLPVWVLVLTLMVVSGGSSIEQLYDTPAARAEVAASMSANSSLRSMYGPVFGDSIGGLVAWRFGVFAATLAAVMSLIIVIRHTREEEETGRQELLSSAMVGRRAPLTSALFTALVANALVTLFITGGLAAQGGTGALALGLAVGATGMLFATMAAIVAQLTESARLAKGMTGGVLGLAFLLRAAGDSGVNDGSSVLTWLSPIGWAENMRPYAGERWWVLLLFVAAIAAQAAAAYTLAGRRDIGMGFLPARPGPAEGRLATAGGLALRLQRGTLLGWTAGFAVAGVVFGGMAEGAADLVGDNEQAKEIFARMGGQEGMTQAFLATMVGMLGMMAALYVVASILRLHSEETSQRAEPLLANRLGRLRWAAGHLVIAFGGAVAIMLVGGLGLAVGYGDEFGAVLGAALVQVPAIWLLGGLAVLLYGALPKAAPAAWGVVGACLLIGWIGPALDLPQSVMNLSPFGHLPKLPGTEMQWAPVLLLTAMAVALTGAGLAALRRRDLLT